MLSKTSEYSLKILSFMATEDYPQYTAKLLYEKLDIPHSYTARIMSKLAKNGFVKSLRGRKGGFVFAKDIRSIYLSDIISAIDGFESFDKCLLGRYQCDLENPCPMHEIWAETRKKIIDTLTGTSLADLQKTKIKGLDINKNDR